jgi:hypothetical protein
MRRFGHWIYWNCRNRSDVYLKTWKDSVLFLANGISTKKQITNEFQAHWRWMPAYCHTWSTSNIYFQMVSINKFQNNEKLPLNKIFQQTNHPHQLHVPLHSTLAVYVSLCSFIEHTNLFLQKFTNKLYRQHRACKTMNHFFVCLVNLHVVIYFKWKL